MPIPSVVVLAVVIPVYNERELLPRLIARLDATERPRHPDGTPLTRHIVLADDGSTDGTQDWIAEHLAGREDCTCLYAKENHGKGSAIRRGFHAAPRPWGGHRADPGRRPGVRPRRPRRRPRPDPRRPGRRGHRQPIPGPDPPRALLLAQRRQPGHLHAEQHVQQPQPHRHRVRHQGLHRAHASPPSPTTSAKTASASSPS